MKLSSIFVASSALSGFVAATPVEKRGVTWVTVTDVVATTVDVVKTIYVTGGDVTAQATGAPAPVTNPEPHRHQHNHPKAQHHHHSGTSNNPAADPEPALQHKPKPKPQSVPAPVPAPSPKPSPQPSSSSGTSGQTMSGDMTYYDVGLGSCGWTSTPSENVVALSYKIMNNGANPNDNPLCGRTITISYQGVTQTAKVVDTCMGCQGAGDVDMSTGLFQKFAPMSVGRVTSGMTWHYD